MALISVNGKYKETHSKRSWTVLDVDHEQGVVLAESDNGDYREFPCHMFIELVDASEHAGDELAEVLSRLF